MERVFVVTLWSGGRPGRRWKSLEPPAILPSGTGVIVRCLDTKLNVTVIGSISVEEFEQGAEAGENGSGCGPKKGEQDAEGLLY